MTYAEKLSLLTKFFVKKDNCEPIEDNCETVAEKALMVKLEKNNLKDRFTKNAFLTLLVLSEDNPGFIQILALECLQGHDKLVTTEHIFTIYDNCIPMHSEYRDVWLKQKYERGNMVDNGFFWKLIGDQHLTYDKAVEEFNKEYKESVNHEKNN